MLRVKAYLACSAVFGRDIKTQDSSMPAYGRPTGMKDAHTIDGGTDIWTCIHRWQRKKTKNRSDITTDPGEHRVQHPYTQGRTRAQQDQAQASAPGQNQTRSVGGAMAVWCSHAGSACSQLVATFAGASAPLIQRSPLL